MEILQNFVATEKLFFILTTCKRKIPPNYVLFFPTCFYLEGNQAKVAVVISPFCIKKWSGPRDGGKSKNCYKIHILVVECRLSDPVFSILVILMWRGAHILRVLRHPSKAPRTPPVPRALPSKYGPLGGFAWYGSSSARELILQ